MCIRDRRQIGRGEGPPLPSSILPRGTGPAPDLPPEIAQSTTAEDFPFFQFLSGKLPELQQEFARFTPQLTEEGRGLSEGAFRNLMAQRQLLNLQTDDGIRQGGVGLIGTEGQRAIARRRRNLINLTEDPVRLARLTTQRHIPERQSFFDFVQERSGGLREEFAASPAGVSARLGREQRAEQETERQQAEDEARRRRSLFTGRTVTRRVRA